VTPEERARLLGRYGDGVRAVNEALAAVADLDRAEPGEWSARQIMHHLADAELFHATRLRQLLFDDNPLIQAYDEQVLAERLHYYRPVETSLALFRAAIESSIELAVLLFPEDWSRAGNHEERGPYSLETWLELAANHPHEHVEQLRVLAQG
jgi:hypothetical protein